jgi:hypothetical protein
MKKTVVITLLIVALLLAAAGIGAVVFFAIRGADFAFFEVPLVSATAEEGKNLKIDVEKPVTLKVDDDAGDVSIVGGDVKAVKVQIIKTAYATNQSRAEETLQNLQYEIRQNGNTITLIYKLSGRQTREVNTMDFIVTVPTETVVEIENGFGTVDVADVNGNVGIVGDFGDVTVKNVEGELAIENNSGKINVQAVDAAGKDVKVDSDFGEITLEKINGRNVSIMSNSGTVTVTNVRASGDMYIKSDFGNTSYENGSAASLTLETKSGKTSITKVNVSDLLKINSDFGEIELTQAMAGSYDLQTNSGTINIDGAKGNLKAYTDFGDIDIVNAKSVLLDLKTNSGSIQFSGSPGEGLQNVESDFGNIDLSIPADSQLNVDLKTDFGKISSDIPITVTLTGESDGNHQTGTMNSGGELLTVQTKNGNISITAIK